MTKKISVIALLMILTTSILHAQGIFSLLGIDSKPKYKVKFLDGDENAEEEILQIRIRGVIQEKDETGEIPFKMEKDMIEEVKKDLKLARERKAIKAILLDINSPGGEVTASDILYHIIVKTKQEIKKPVIALIGTLGASGAYYVACSADKIIAHPTSIIGSIGVLMQSINVEGLAEKLGVKARMMKSEKTPKKDILSPFRDLTDAEKKMLMEIINGVYDRFVDIVSSSRNKTREEIEKIADGGIYNAQKSLEIGLIDKIGYQDDAIALACEMTGLKSAALVRRYTQKSLSEVLSEMTEMNLRVPEILMSLKNLLENSNVPQVMLKLSIP
ncbi:MAG: hypothetical protein Kow0029_32030 [Candidatus Rifleibacteriota bacterium]